MRLKRTTLYEMPKLQVMAISTRPGRKGIGLARWFNQFANDHGGFESQLVDLAEVNLPLIDEPHHPRLRKYEHEHTKAWSALVDSADAYVFVTPEYNYSAPPTLTNALDYLSQEWAYKPVSFVSYGGVSGGLRAVQQIKLTVTALKMMPIPELVAVQMFTEFLDDAGNFTPSKHHQHSGKATLDELLRWSNALATLRG